MKMQSRNIKKILSYFSIIAITIVSIFLVLGLVDIAVNWSGDLIVSIRETFGRIGQVFLFGNWPKLSTINLLANAFVIIVIGVTLIVLVGWVLVSVSKKRYFYLLGAGLHLIVGYGLIAYTVSVIPVHDNLIQNTNILNISLLIVLILTYFVMTALLVLTIIDAFRIENIIKEETMRQIIISEEMVVTEEETIIEEEYILKDKTETLPPETISKVIVPSPFGSGKKKPRPPFALKLRRGEDHIRDMYNEIKAEFLSYGLNSRISLVGDSFRLHTKTYAVIQVVGKSLKINYALNCNDYAETTIPFTDSGKQKRYEEVPFTFKTRSNLSIKRAKELIRDAVNRDGITRENEPVQKNYARETIETLKTSQYYLKNFARK